MEPESILARVKAKYLEFDSYSDEGIVSTDMAVSGNVYTNKTEFKTYFVRPDKVRFEWQMSKDNPLSKSDVDRNVIWSNGTDTKYFFLGRKRRHENLSMAIAAASGVSQGAVNMILKLLMPTNIGLLWFWSEMADARLIEEVGGFRCHHIVGSTKNADDAEVWISKEDYMVRRLRRKLVITSEFRESSHKMGVEALKKFGLPQEQIDVVEQVHASSVRPESEDHYHEYSYNKVRIDEKLSDDLFTSGPPEDR